MSTLSQAPVASPKATCMYSDCGHSWTPRTSKTPAECPKCKRYDWQTGSTKKKTDSGGKDVNTQEKDTSHKDTSLRNSTHNKPGIRDSGPIGPNTEKFIKERRPLL